MRLCYLSAAVILAGQAYGDFLVATYPGPTDFTNKKSTVYAGWQNITSTLNDAFKGNKTRGGSSVLAGLRNITFSLGMFSLHSLDARQLQFHHTSPDVQEAKIGTNKVDDNSIYRVASVSKLITVLAGMVELTDEEWNRPLSNILPGLKQYISNDVETIKWDKITPWSLAAQLSGIPTIGLAIGDSYSQTKAATYGGPPENVTAFSPCAARLLKNPLDQYCSVNDTIATVGKEAPNFLPWSTPVYSDLNFMLLGAAISNITGRPISSIYQSSIFKPLNMTSSNDTHPTGGEELKRAVVAGPPASNFALETDITTPSGGILSTISDLQKLGEGILGSKLLSANATRKWMKPVSHMASLSHSIGAPWEIHRFVNPVTSKVTDLYTKLGDSGFYGGTLVIIPQYDAGFTFLNAGADPKRSPKALGLLDYVTEIIIPALEAQATAEAKSNFVGTFEGADNSTITIALNQSTPISVKADLVVKKWIYNGTNVLAGPFFNSIQPRLEQSIPNQAKAGSAGKVIFQLSVNAQLETYTAGMEIPDLGIYGPWTDFYTGNGDFAMTDQMRWAGKPVQQLAFEVDEKGKATTCTSLFQQVKMKRQN